MGSKVENILQNLTLEEKISLLSGKNFWETIPILEKGVPAIKVCRMRPASFLPTDYFETTDGPNGARGEVFTGGTRAACFPAAVCSASSWNLAFSRSIGNALAEETKTKGARVLYVP